MGGEEPEDTVPLSPDRIMELGRAFRASKTLLSAVELDVFTVLADRPLDLETLRTEIGVAERGARDFFDALVALGMLERDATDRYSNTPETARYLVRGKSSYVGGELHHLNNRLYPRWGRFTTALRTGEPQGDENRTNHYSTIYDDPVALEALAKGMTGASLMPGRRMAELFPWRDYETVLDIGTAQGAVPVELALAHPHLSGRGFDLAPMRPIFEAYAGAHGVADRMRFYAGDFFADPWPKCDVIVMGRILHNWDLPTKMALLHKAYEALPQGGALIVHERLIDDERRVSASGLLASLTMLLVTAGGFDYSGADCAGWLREAGFRETRVEPLAAEQSMVIGLK